MSNAMRMGKRTLAGVAAGALGAALIPFVGVGTASAAVTSVTQPSAVRAGVATAATGYAINGTSLGSSADAYIFSVLSGTQFGGNTPSVADAGGSNSPDGTGVLVQPGAVTFDAANAGTTVIVGVYAAVGTGGNCTFTALGATGVAPTATPSAGSCAVNLVSSFSQPVGGAIASIAMTPATATTVVGEAQAYAITATDSTGRRTLTATGDSITSVSANPAVATAGAFTQTGDLMSISATGVAAGSTTITAIPQNNAVTPVQSAITVTANGATSATTDVTLSGSNILANATTVGARTYFANPAVTSFTFSVSGLAAGETYRFTTTGTATESPASGVITASASGTASQVVTVTSPAAGQTVQLTVASAAGGAGSKLATATYQAPVFAWQTPTPADNSVLFGTASGTLPIAVTITDQYGNPAVSTVLTLTQGGTTVDTKLTNASGQATVTANVGASGSLAYVLTPTGGGAAAGALNYSVTAGTPDLTVVSGLSTALATVTTPSWTNDDLITTADTTPVVLKAAQNLTGINGVPVTVTAGSGVLLFASAPGGGVASSTGVTSLSLTTAGAGANAGEVSFWATSSVAGAVTLSASAGGVTVSGGFTGGAPVAAAARNVAVAAPSSIEPGGVAIVTVTATDNFGSAVGGADVTLTFDPTSPGYFANGARSALVETGANGQAQITVTSGVNETGTIVLAAGASGEQQFGAAANRLTAAAVTDDAPGYAASNAPSIAEIELSASPAEKSLLISAYRSGGTVVVDGDALGFERGDSVKLETRKWNAKKKKWSSWKTQATVLVKKDESFSGIISISAKVRVRAQADGVKSSTVTVNK